MGHTIFTSNLSGRMRAAFFGSAMLLATASLTAPVMAAEQQPTTATATEAIGPHTHQIHGVVKSTPAAGATTFTVTTERFGDVSVTFAGATVRGHGHAHGRARSFEVAKASDLKGGDRVVVQGRTSQDGKTFIARRVHLLPARGDAAHPSHIVGTIATVSTSNGNTTLTITPANGSASQTVTVTPDTRVRPEGKSMADLTVGTKVTVVSKNGTATGIVVMPA